MPQGSTDEVARLRALRDYGLLESPASAELEAILRIAAAVAGVPTATLNILDSTRQCQLTTVGFEGSDTPRDESMCEVTLQERRTLHVPDASDDPRFVANPWVTGTLASVRFYASLPLFTPAGHVLGTLCVFDDVVRELDEATMARLADCADVVMALFERHRAVLQERHLAAEATEQRELMQLVHAELEERHELLDAVLETVDVGVVVVDATGHLSMLNRTAREWHATAEDVDVDPDQFPERYQLLRTDGLPMPADEVPVTRAFRDGEVTDAELVIAAPGKEPRTVVAGGRRLVALDGRSLGAVVAMSDVTERRRQEARLRRSEARFRSAFDQAPNPMAVVSDDLRWLDVNPALCAWLGWSREDLLGRPTAGVDHPDDRALRLSVTRDLVAQGGSTRVERRFRHSRGEFLWGRLSVAVVPGIGSEQQLICQVEDITDERAAQQRLTRLALHDHLTGLPNRVLLSERVQHALAVSARDGSQNAVLFCDLDGFKAVNDSFGHAVGDELLVSVATRLVEAVRPSDTVARLGGDEFVVLLENVTAEQVEDVRARLTAAIEDTVATTAGPVRVGVSIGVTHPLTGTGPEAAALAVRDADARMYLAKQTRGAPGVPVPRLAP